MSLENINLKAANGNLALINNLKNATKINEETSKADMDKAVLAGGVNALDVVIINNSSSTSGNVEDHQAEDDDLSWLEFNNTLNRFFDDAIEYVDTDIVDGVDDNNMIAKIFGELYNELYSKEDETLNEKEVESFVKKLMQNEEYKAHIKDENVLKDKLLKISTYSGGFVSSGRTVENKTLSAADIGMFVLTETIIESFAPTDIRQNFSDDDKKKFDTLREEVALIISSKVVDGGNLDRLYEDIAGKFKGFMENEKNSEEIRDALIARSGNQAILNGDISSAKFSGIIERFTNSASADGRLSNEELAGVGNVILGYYANAANVGKDNNDIYYIKGTDGNNKQARKDIGNTRLIADIDKDGNATQIRKIVGGDPVSTITMPSENGLGENISDTFGKGVTTKTPNGYQNYKGPIETCKTNDGTKYFKVYPESTNGKPTSYLDIMNGLTSPNKTIDANGHDIEIGADGNISKTTINKDGKNAVFNWNGNKPTADVTQDGFRYTIHYQAGKISSKADIDSEWLKTGNIEYVEDQNGNRVKIDENGNIISTTVKQTGNKPGIDFNWNTNEGTVQLQSKANGGAHDISYTVSDFNQVNGKDLDKTNCKDWSVKDGAEVFLNIDGTKYKSTVDANGNLKTTTGNLFGGDINVAIDWTTNPPSGKIEADGKTFDVKLKNGADINKLLNDGIDEQVDKITDPTNGKEMIARNGKLVTKNGSIENKTIVFNELPAGFPTNGNFKNLNDSAIEKMFNEVIESLPTGFSPNGYVSGNDKYFYLPIKNGNNSLGYAVYEVNGGKANLSSYMPLTGSGNANEIKNTVDALNGKTSNISFIRSFGSYVDQPVTMNNIKLAQDEYGNYHAYTKLKNSIDGGDYVSLGWNQGVGANQSIIQTNGSNNMSHNSVNHKIFDGIPQNGKLSTFDSNGYGVQRDPIGYSERLEDGSRVIHEFVKKDDFVGAQNGWVDMDNANANNDKVITGEELTASGAEELVTIIDADGNFVSSERRAISKDLSINIDTRVTKEQDNSISHQDINEEIDADGNGLKDQTLVSIFKVQVGDKVFNGFQTDDDEVYLKNNRKLVK